MHVYIQAPAIRETHTHIYSDKISPATKCHTTKGTGHLKPVKIPSKTVGKSVMITMKVLA